MQLYLDLDGVFADFDGFCTSLGINYLENPSKAWNKLDTIHNLFQRFDPIPGSVSFFEAIRSIVPNPKILTALPQLTGELYSAPIDKRAWVREYLSPDLQVITTPSWEGKKDFAKGNILIDDSRRNILDWEYHGGIGIWHTSKDHTYSLNQLKKIYELT